MSPRHPLPEIWALLLTTLGATFSQGCSCEEERPYTPFQVATALPGAQPADEPPSAEDSAVQSPTRTISTIGDRPESWQVFGKELQAPPGTGFVTAIELPTDDGTSEVAAWTLPKNGQSLGGEAGLWLLDAKGRPKRRLLAVPAHLPTGKDCRHRIRLINSGERSFSSLLEADCDSRLLPGTATGALILVDPTLEVPERLAFRLRPPASGESLRFAPDSQDADGDGMEDFALRVTLTAPSGVEESLVFRWVGRASGLSHVAKTPLDELQKRASRLAIASVRKKEREQGLLEIDAFRRLLFSSCAESKTEKLTDGGGAGLSCGGLRGLSERLTTAAIQAHLGMGTPWKALGELERSSSSFGGPSAGTFADWKKKIRAAVQTVSVHATQSAPLPIGLDVPYPVASPLRFDRKGQLFSLTGSGRVKGLFLLEEEPSPAPPPPLAGEGAPEERDEALKVGSDSRPQKPKKPAPWPLRPAGQAGEMLSAAIPSCERSEVQLAFTGSHENLLPPRPLAFLAPRPGGCRSLMSQPLPAVVVNWEGGRVLAIVGGEPVVSAGRLEAPEVPLVWGTSLGVARLSQKGFQLLVGEDTEEAHHCVADAHSDRVACVQKKKAILLEKLEE